MASTSLPEGRTIRCENTRFTPVDDELHEPHIKVDSSDDSRSWPALVQVESTTCRSPLNNEMDQRVQKRAVSCRRTMGEVRDMFEPHPDGCHHGEREAARRYHRSIRPTLILSPPIVRPHLRSKQLRWDLCKKNPEGGLLAHLCGSPRSPLSTAPQNVMWTRFSKIEGRTAFGRSLMCAGGKNEEEHVFVCVAKCTDSRLDEGGPASLSGSCCCSIGEAIE